jgi:hypothetical protein
VVLVGGGRADALAYFFGVVECILSVEEVPDGKEQRCAAYCDAVIVVEDDFLVDFCAVDKHTVFAVHIEDGVAPVVLVEAELHMLSGDVLVGDLNGEVFITADDIGALAEAVEIALARAGCYNETGHPTSKRLTRVSGR